MIPDRKLDISIAAKANSTGVSALEKSLDSVRNSLGEAAGASKLTEEQLEDLDRELKEVAASSSAASGSLSGLGSTAVTTEMAIEALDGSLDDLNDKQKEAFGDTMTDLITENKTGMEDLVDETKEFNDQLDRLDKKTVSEFFQGMDEKSLNRRTRDGGFPLIDNKGKSRSDIFGEVFGDAGDRFVDVADDLEQIEDTGVVGASGSIQEYMENMTRNYGGQRRLDPDLRSLSEAVDPSNQHSGLIKALASDDRFETAGDVIQSTELPSGTKQNFQKVFESHFGEAIAESDIFDADKLTEKILGDIDAESDLGIANALGMDGIDIDNKKLAQLAEIDGILREYTMQDVRSMYNPDKRGVFMGRGAFSHFLENHVNDLSDLTPGKAREFHTDDGDMTHRADADTQVDMMAKMVQDLRDAGVNDEIWEEIIGDRRAKAKVAGSLRRGPDHGLLDNDVLGELGIDADGTDVGKFRRGNIAKGKLREGVSELTQLAKANPDFARGIAELGEDDSLFDALDSVSGSKEGRLRRFLEDYEEELEKVLFPEKLINLIDKQETIRGSDDIEDKLSHRNNLSSIQQGRLSRAILNARPGLVGSGVDEETMRKGIPREVIEANLFEQMLNAESKPQMQQTRKILRGVQSGSMGIEESMIETDVFRERFNQDMSRRLVGGGLNPRSAVNISEELNDQMADIIADGDNEINTLRQLLQNGPALDEAVSATTGGMSISEMTDDEIVSEYVNSLGETHRARMREENPQLAALLSRADIPDDVVAGDMRSGAQGDGSFLPSAENSGRAVSALRDYRSNNKFRLMAAGGLGRITSGLDALDLSDTGINEVTDSVHDMHDALDGMIPMLNVSSANMGAFNVQTKSITSTFIKLIALIGPVAAAVLGFANALISATVAMGAFMAVGAIGFLNEIEENTAGVNNKMEAMQELMGELKDLAGVAVEPLANAEVGGMSSIDFFIRNLKGALLMLRDFSRISANIVESSEFENFYSEVSNAMNLGAPGAFEESIAGAVKDLLPSLTDLLVRMISGAYKFVNGITRIAEVLGDSWGPALDMLVKLFPLIVQYGTSLLMVIGEFASAVAWALGFVFKLNQLLTDLFAIVGMDINVLRGLFKVTGMLVGAVYAAELAVILLNSTLVTTMGTVLKSIWALGAWIATSGAMSTAANFLTTSVWGLWASLKALETATVIGLLISTAAALGIFLTQTEMGKELVQDFKNEMVQWASAIREAFAGSIEFAEEKLAALLDMLALFQVLTNPATMAAYVQASGGIGGLAEDVMGSPGTSTSGPSSMDDVSMSRSGSGGAGGAGGAGDTVVQIQGDAYGPSIEDMIFDAVNSVLDEQMRNI